MNITAIQNNEKATMKIKHPKRNEDGNIVYETDGTTIVYEEKELLNNTEYMITLNELGKEDTNITILITAEDGKTTDEYKIKIKRPYGTIKGGIQDSSDDWEANRRGWRGAKAGKNLLESCSRNPRDYYK